MGHKTPLYDCHLAANGKIVDFAGWDMPLHYGSQLQEHYQVRQHAGLFDVSHMTIVDLAGRGVRPYLRRLLANNIDRLYPGKALYSCMLNEAGGVIDDLIVYQRGDQEFRLVVNAATRDKDLQWLRKQQAGFDVTLTERRDLAILAIQGPETLQHQAVIAGGDEAILKALINLKPFHFIEQGQTFIARTGYTGEYGFEVLLPAEAAVILWQQLLASGVKPCGLGARDTLRLEAGMNLYGLDMDETVSPLVSNLSWTVMFEPADREFIGRQALLQQQALGIHDCLVGLVLTEGGVLRPHQTVVTDNGKEGITTSGTFSPTLSKGIALARVPIDVGTSCSVLVRHKPLHARVIQPPFVRQGKQAF